MALTRTGGYLQLLADATAPVSFTVSFATAPAATDLIIVHVGWDGTLSGLTLPTNLTWVAGQPLVASGTLCSAAVLYAIGDGIEGDAAHSFAFSWTGNQATWVWAEVISGADTTTPFDATPTLDLESATFVTNNTSPSITTVTDNAFVYRLMVLQTASKTLTSPAGPTELANAASSTGTGDIVAAITIETQATAGATGTATFVSSSGVKHAAVTVAIRPAAAGGIAYTRTAADNVGITDAASAVQTSARAPAGVVGITDAATATQTASRPSADAVGITDAASAVQTSARAPGDVVGITDSVTVTLTAAGTITRVVADNVGITDGLTVVVTSARTGADAVGITDTVTVTLTAATWLYSPPTETGARMVPIYTEPSWKQHAPVVPLGLTVLETGGVYSASTSPTVDELAAADNYYLGGHITPVSNATKTAIEASGIGGTFEVVP